MSKDKQKVSSDIQKNESILGKWILPILSVLAVSTFPALFMYFQNADEAGFSEVVVPLLIFIAAGAVFFFLFLIITRSTSKSAVIASVFMVVLLNYSLLERVVQKIFPSLRYWHILPIFLFILAHVAWYICKKIQKELANTIVLVVCIVFSGLVLFNAAIATPTITNKLSLEKQTREQSIQKEQVVKEDAGMPNIYFLLFDEYSSIDFMKKYYDYDNSAFTDYLESLGFNVSYTSHNESIMTTTIVTNYVNLDYVVNNYTSEPEKETIRHNNLLFKLLKENNYTIMGIGDSSFLGLENAAGSLDSAAKTAGGDTLEILVWEKTAVYPLVKKSYSENASKILNSIEYIKNYEYHPNNNQFTFLYLNPSHTPFVFKENGDILLSGFSNWRDKKYYLGAYKYTTKLITEIIDSILEKDPECIIILQSDHSARASTDLGLFMEIFKLEDMNNHFNAIYYRGDYLDVSGLSGVNTWRVIVNKLFNKNYEKVEVPVDEYKYK